MDHDRFDALTRTISSRRALGGVIAGTVAGLLGLTEARATRCPKSKKRCGKKCIPKKGCCTTAQCKPRNSGKVCKGNRCACPAGTKLCQNRCLSRAAACPLQPDASCQPGSGILDDLRWFDRTAQTFTAPNGGRLTRVDLWIRNESTFTSGVYELLLDTVDPVTGIPRDESLAGTQRSSDTVSDTELEWVRFDFTLPPLLQPGQQYALVLSMIGGTGNNGWITERRIGNPCPGGTFFIDVDNSGTFTPLLDSGTPYRTFVTS